MNFFMQLQLDMDAYYNETTLHPLGLAAVLVLGGMMVLVPRRWAILPMLVMACFIAPAQRIVPFGFDFSLLRMMVLFGWMRVVITGEYRALQWKPMDTLFTAWMFVSLVSYTLLHGNTDALVNRLGYVYEGAGMYFLFRILVRNWDDVFSLVRGSCIVCALVACVLAIEQFTGRNMFSIFGGVPEITQMREGRIRARGAFAHPIMAGTFWAVLMPLMIPLIRMSSRGLLLATVGIVSTLVCVIACASSTPMIAVMIAFMAFATIYIRHHLGWVRYGVVMAMVVLHCVMIPPIWHLMARLNFVPGSTGYYRYKLFDGFVNHFNEWAIIGTRSTTHWWSWGTHDLTNQYVLEGVNGGLLTLALFVGLLFVGFREVRHLARAEERRGRYVAAAWALGASLFVHAVTFMSVSYFGQIKMTLYLSLALIASLSPRRMAVVVRRAGAMAPTWRRPTVFLPPRPIRTTEFSSLFRIRL